MKAGNVEILLHSMDRVFYIYYEEFEMSSTNINVSY